MARIGSWLGGALVALLPCAGAAQEAGWDYRVTLYGWMAGLDSTAVTPLGTVNAELRFRDVLSNLKMAFMGAFEARNGPWGLIGDIVYSDLAMSRDDPLGGAFSSVTLAPRLTAATGLVAYRIRETQAAAIDLAAGLRYVKLDTAVDFAAGPSFASDRSWVDPVIGLRVSGDFSESWYGRIYADAGGWDGSSTWQLAAVAGYRISPAWSAEFGYRRLQVKTDMSPANMSLDMSGPMLGISARF